MSGIAPLVVEPKPQGLPVGLASIQESREGELASSFAMLPVLFAVKLASVFQFLFRFPQPLAGGFEPAFQLLEMQSPFARTLSAIVVPIL